MTSKNQNYKTNQNLERLSKVSEKLNNIHLNIESEKYSKFEDIELRISNIDNKHIESSEQSFKQFNALKEQISTILKQIEEDRQDFDQKYENRTQHIRMLEFKIMEKFEEEATEREETDRRLMNLVEEKHNVLKYEISKESKCRTDSVENFHFYLESEIPKILDQMEAEQREREDQDNNINDLVNNEFERLHGLLSHEKASRQETEEAFLDMLRTTINKMKAELENEKKERESTEETLLGLLEETTEKLEYAATI